VPVATFGVAAILSSTSDFFSPRNVSRSSRDFHVLFLEAGQLSGDADFLIGFTKLQVRPREAAVQAAERRHAEAAEAPNFFAQAVTDVGAERS
jgi:hypothetical protein